MTKESFNISNSCPSGGFFVVKILRMGYNVSMEKLKKGDKIAVVSLSSGVLGESFVAHEVEIAKKRIESMGFSLAFMDNSQKGLEFLKNNPKAKADDLLQAFLDKDTKVIISAIGGDNAFEICPYVFENKMLVDAIKNNPKPFLGFSDSTTNHLIFYKLGVKTFYGQCLLVDVAELDEDMLEYSKQHFESFLGGKTKNIESSKVWFEERKDFSPNAVGTKRMSHKEERGFVEINKTSDTVCGELFGGCIDVLFDLLTGDAHPLAKTYNDKYQIFPTDAKFYENKILFLETSDAKPTPEVFEKYIDTLLSLNILKSCRGILFGKPQDEKYIDEYEKILREKIKDTPILFNMNFGHALPHAILSFGEKAKVDFDKRIIEFV